MSRRSGRGYPNQTRARTQREIAVALNKWDMHRPAASARGFRDAWYAGGGTPLFFLFGKNLSVTNVQFAELLALLRLHTFDAVTDRRAEALYFLTTEEFDRLIAEMVEPFADRKDRGRTVASLYSELLDRTVLVDPLFGSCQVLVPPSLRVDLPAISGEAAYLHSCGYLVFARKSTEATQSLLHDHLVSHLGRHRPVFGERLRFLVFSDEGFTPKDRHDASALKAGLDEVKIHVDKAWFHTDRLVDVVDHLKVELADEMLFGLDPDDAPREGDEELDETRTIWLIQDRGVGLSGTEPGQDRYFICYDQLLRSRSAVLIFDENKPGWHDHTTMPPSLAGSLLNIARRPERARDILDVADPFVGTGTSLLEAARLPGLRFRGSDSHEATRILIGDNLRIFAMSAPELRALVDDLEGATAELAAARQNGGDPRGTQISKISQSVLQTADFAQQARSLSTIPPLDADLLAPDLPGRILAYVAYRASKRHSARFARTSRVGNEEWWDAYTSELTLLLSEMRTLVALREQPVVSEQHRVELLTSIDASPHLERHSVLIENEFSTATLPTAHLAGADIGGDFTLAIGPEQGDALSLPKDSCDIIIGDPPYGFNTHEETAALAELYRRFARVALLALRDGGDLILCLPERSHSGRYSPSFTHKDLVVQQLLLSAGAVGKQLVFPQEHVKGASAVFTRDFYWESHRALRRSIVHVQVRDRPS